MKKLFGLLKIDFLKNAVWLIAGRIVQMLISVIITVITARFLGPSNYGIINYVDSFVAFFAAISTLGIENVIVKCLVDKNKNQGMILGTALSLQLLSSLFSVLMIVALVSLLNPSEPLYRTVALLYSMGMFFKCFEVVQYWYQSFLHSSRYALASTIAYVGMSLYRFYLLLTGKGIEWFAFSTTVDSVFLAVILFFFYKYDKGPKFKFSFIYAKELLSQSYHFILSGLMIATYWQIAKVMLRHMIDETAVGLYSTATKICSLWPFILVAIIDSMRPVLLTLYETNEENFKKKLLQLHSCIIYISFFVSILITIFSPIFIPLLYGDLYYDSILILQIMTWATAFSYIGMARNIWILAYKQAKYEKYMALIGTICNVILNILFIPFMGAVGAAIANTLTQIIVNYVVMFFIKDLKQYGFLITKSFNPNNLVEIIRNREDGNIV